MFRNAFAFIVVASALALTGCSKCSEKPAADAPATDATMTAPVDGTAAPAVDAAAPAPGNDAPPGEPAPGATPNPEAQPPAGK